MIDLSKLSREQLDRFFHLESIRAKQQQAAERVRILRAYYDGEHPTFLSDRQKEYLEPTLRAKQTENGPTLSVSFTEGQFAFAHNTIKSVIDTLRERLSVSGFTVNDEGVDDEGDSSPEMELARIFWGWWEDNRMDAQQIRLYRRALRDGLSYVMVDYDTENQRPRFTLHHVDDYTSGIVRHRDPEMPDRTLYDCKYFWTYDLLKPGETGKARKTVYLPHEIRKYIQDKAGFWQTYSDPDDVDIFGTTRWPLPWLDAQGKPLGIATIEFENPGGSEVGQIIGLQNALNKSWLDLMAAADSAGFPVIAIEYDGGGDFPSVTDDDDIEDDDEFFMAPGRAIELDGGRAHRIEGADLSQLISTIHLIIETIAGVSRVPQSYLYPAGGSDVPSGEALKQLESGLVARAIERQLIFGQSWSDVMTTAYRVAKTFGNVPLPDLPKMKVQTLWKGAETRNEKLEAETAEILKRLGIPDEELFSLLGFSPEKISQWQSKARADRAIDIATIATNLRTLPQANTQNGNGNQANQLANVNGNGANNAR